MKKNQWSPERIFQTSGNYWQACTLQTGVSLGVFTELGDRKLTASQVAQGINCNARAAEMLLNALVAMGLLQKSGQFYENTPFSEEYLVEGARKYIGYMVKHHQALVKCWARLDEAVKTGEPLRSGPSETEEDRKNFILGMHNLAMGAASQVAKAVDLEGRKMLLDLGGGPGTYAIHFCLEYPALRAVVYDLPATRPYAERIIREFGLEDRVEFVDGNYLDHELPGSYDVAWVSHILHAEGPEVCQIILDKVSKVLKTGGILIIHDFFLADTHDGPLSPALFSLNMLVNTKEGRAYSEGEVKEMLKNAGAIRADRLPFEGPNASGIIVGQF